MFFLGGLGAKKSSNPPQPSGLPRHFLRRQFVRQKKVTDLQSLDEDFEVGDLCGAGGQLWGARGEVSLCAKGNVSEVPGREKC